jgi:hypothetical protein
MSTALISRLAKLEKRFIPTDPLKAMTDEELDARMAEITARIEHATGMPIELYGDYLQQTLDAGEPQLDGLTLPEFKSFIASCKKLGDQRSKNDR